MKLMILSFALGLLTTSALAKLPAPPPKPPDVIEADKVKAADAAKKEAELNAKYMDKAAASWSAKARADGKEFKPLIGPGVPPPAPTAAAPPVAAAPAAAAPPVAAAPTATPAKK